jgi:hypothetical protein
LSEGDSFEQDRTAVVGSIPDLGAGAHKQGIGYVSVNDGQHVLTAALMNDWTVLKSSPASAEPSPPAQFPGAKKN